MINLAVNVDLLSGLLAGTSCVFTGPCGPLTVYLVLTTVPIREVNWLLIISVLISLWRIVHSNPTHRNEMPHIMYLRTFVREVQPHVVALSVVFGLINHADRRRSQ